MLASLQLAVLNAGFVLAAAGDKAAPKAQPPGGILGLLIPIIAIMAIWYFLMIRPQNKERSRRQDMLGSLKKNDRVVTTSGMLGTVANISQDGKEVTVKFGDSTRIPFVSSAIQTVIQPESSEESS